MYGLIGQMRAQPGQRSALVDLLLGGLEGMPGCRAYIVALDEADADAIWITEVWDDQASHDASLGLPSVQQTIARARPLIAGFGAHVQTQPLGGIGLPASS
jgi:quinol monooxygenase YgiN